MSTTLWKRTAIMRPWLIAALALLICLGDTLFGEVGHVASAEAGWIEVRTPAELAAIGMDASSLAQQYRLMADINLTEAWLPLGSLISPFTGQFDGNGKKITNLAIVDTTLDAAGLFASIGAGALVSNLEISAASITASSDTGILAGVNAGEISRCAASGVVSGQDRVGGLVGSNSGTLADSYARATVSGRDLLGGLVGSNTGSVSTCYAASSVDASVFSNYLSFDGDDYVQIQHNPTYATTTFTVEAWFQWDAVNQVADNVQFIMGKGFEQFELHTEGGSGQNGLRFIPIGASGGDSWLDVPEALQPGWFHVAATLTYEAAAQRAAASIFINGVARDIWQNSKNVGKVAYMLNRPSNPLVANASDITIGCRDGHVMLFQGKIADVRIWNRALTASEIAANKDKKLQGNEPGLVGYWKLDEESGQALDSTSTGNHGDVFGATRTTGSASNLGGLVGGGSGAVTSCYYDSDIFARAGNGKGAGKSTLDMQELTNYSGWDFQSTWANSPSYNAAYPYLRPIASVFAGGMGVLGDPYQVSTAAELALVAVKVNSENATHGAAHYALTNDINLPPVSELLSNHQPIGSGGQVFSGVLDGNSHVVRGLEIHQADGTGVGLFGTVDATGIVRSVSLFDSVLVGGGHAGAIAAINHGLLENCHQQGTVSTSSSGEFGVGGLVGSNSGQVRNSSGSGSVVGSGATHVGGLIGISDAGLLQDSFNRSDVTGAVAAGLVGTDHNGTAQNAYNVGNVTGVDLAAGLIGRAIGSHVENCYSLVTPAGASTTGGLAADASGAAETPAIFRHCYWSDSLLPGFGVQGAGLTYEGAATFADSQGVLAAVADHSLISTGEVTSATLKEALNAWVTATRSSVPDLEYWHASAAVNAGYPYLLAPDGLPTFALSYSAASHGQVTGASSQNVLLGGSGTQVVAVPDSGYQFAQWSDGRTEPARTDLAVSGNISAVALFEPAVPPVAGFGSALQFDGTSYVEIPTSSSHNITNNFTIEFWFRSPSNVASYVISRNNNPDMQWAILHQPGEHKMAFYALRSGTGFSGDDPYPLSTIPMPDSSWHHVAYAYDGATLRGFLDGVPVLAQPSVFSLSISDNRLYLGGTVGGSGSPSNLFVGGLDEVRIWKTSLAESTIAAWMYREIDGTHPNYAQLSNYYQLNEGSGALVADSRSDIDGALVPASATGAWQNPTMGSYGVDEDTSLTGMLIGSDADGSSSDGLDWNLTFEIVAQGSKGTVAVTPGSNRFNYTPVLNATGSDQFTYQVRDSKNNLSATHSANVTIRPVNDAPGQPGAFTAPGTGQLVGAGDSVDVAWGAASDVDGDAVTYLLEFYDGGTWISAYSGPATSIQYTIPLGVSATDAVFRVRATDGKGSSAHTLSDVFSAQIPPSSGGDTTVVSPTGDPISVVEDAVQPEYDNIRLVVPTVADTVGALPQHLRIVTVDGGTLQGSGGSALDLGKTGTMLPLSLDPLSGRWGVNLRFTPASNWDTDASFQYVMVDADDNRLNSPASTATIPITSVNDLPSFGVTNGETGDGLFTQFYLGDWNLTGPVSTRVDEQINYASSAGAGIGNVWGMSGVNGEVFSVRWSGSLKAPLTGNYVFQALSDDGVRLWVNDQLIIDQWVPQAPTLCEGSINLTAGHFYNIKLEYYERGGGETIRFTWIKPGDAFSSLVTKEHLYSGFIGNQTVAEDGAVGPLAFTVTDVETAASSLALSASSSNTTLVPDGNIVFGGAGGSRTLSITPAANQSGTSIITVTLGDGLDTVVRSFNLQVTALPRYAVTFLDWNGAVLSSQLVKQNSAAAAPDEPSRPGYRFLQWNTDFSHVVENLTVTAIYELATIPITVTAENKTKTYGDADPALSYRITAGALEEGDSLTGTLTRAPGEVVGSYAISQGTLSGGGKYVITFEPGTLQVTPRALTVTAEDKTKVYGQNNPVFAATYSGFVLGQTVSALGGTLAFNTEASATSGVGVYAITPSGLTSPNYAITFVDGALQVTTKALTVTVDGKSKVYGSADPAFTVSYDGFVAGDDSGDLTGTLTLTRAVGEDVGSYAITPSGLTSDNYAIEFRTGVLQITKKALTITAENATKTYGEANPTFGARYEGFVFDQSETALSGSLTFIMTATASSGVGSYAITPSGVTSNNYEISFVPGTLTVTRAALTVTADEKSKVYGSADPAFTVSYSGLVAGDDSGDLSGTLNLTRAAGENVGSYAITPSGLESGNYEICFVPGELSVTKATLTVTGDEESKVYGSADPAFTVSYSGFVAGDDSGDLTGTLTLTRAAGEDVGSYAITPSSLTSDNYAIEFRTGTLQITRKALTVTAGSTSKAYGEANPVFSVEYEGFVFDQNESALGGSLTFTTTAAESSGVGSYAITPSGVTSNNYEISFVPGTLTVTRAALTVTADEKSKVYGSADPAFTVSYSGFVAGDDSGDLSGTLNLTRAAGENVGSYAITPSGLESGNYEISFVPGTLTVTRAALTVTADEKSKVYGSADPAFTVSYSGFVAGDDSGDLAGTLTLTRAAGEDVGSYAITPSGLTSDNYAIEFRTGTLQITRKALTITAGSTSKAYGEANPVFSVEYEGFVFDQNESALGGSLTFTTTAAESSGVGSYAITPSGVTSNNYEISFVPGTLTVTRAALTVTADEKSKVYGSADPAFTVSYSGFVAGDDSGDLAGTLTLTRAVGENVGSYAITVSGLTRDNYEISFVPGTLTVTKAPLTATADEKSKVYGSADPAFTVRHSGFVAGDDSGDLSGTLNLTRAAGENVGSYAITPSGLTSDNYEISFVPGVLSVTKATLTVTADGENKVYGSADPAFTVSYSGFVAGDDSGDLSGTLNLTRAAGENVGSYAITPSGLESGNYEISFVPGTLTVTRAALTVTADEKSKVYGSADPAFTVSYGGFVAGDDSGDLAGTLTLTRAVGENVGSYTITAAGLTSDNYSIGLVSGVLHVTQKDLTVTAVSTSKVYGSADPAFTVSYSGFVAGDDSADLTGTLTLTRAAGESVGNYPITPSGLTSNNYDLEFRTGVLQITKKALAVTAENATKTYGEANPTFGARYEGFVFDQNESALSGSLIFTTTATASSGVGSYAITPSGVTSENYEVSFLPGALSVTKAALTVTADGKSKVYGSADPVFTVNYNGFVAGDDSADLAGTLSLTRTAGEDVGSYAITPSGLTSDNYAIEFRTGSLHITRKALTISAENATKTYGEANPTFGARYEGFVFDQSETALSGSLTFITTATASSGVGSYAITPSGVTSNNYEISFVPGTLTVTRAALTVTADEKSKVYGSADPAFTVSYSGFVAGDDSGDLAGTLTLTRAVGENVGSYAITVSGLTSDNYEISFVPGTLTVTKAPLTVTADEKSKVYGSADPAFTVRHSGFVAGDDSGDLSGTLNLTRAAGENVGSYAITPSGLESGNYEISFVPGVLSVTKATLTVTGDEESKVYGSADPAFTVSYSGFVVGDDSADLTGTLTLTRAAGESVGNYPITPSGLTSNNYDIEFRTGTLQITRKALTITAENATKTYGEANPTFGARYEGFVFDQSETALSGSLTFITTATASSGVGSYAITPSGLTGNNYEISFVPGTLNVAKAPLTVTADGKNKVYGSADPAFTVSYGGFVAGDDSTDLAGTLSLTRAAGETVGSYTITPSGLESSNYDLEFRTGVLQITKKALTISAENATKTYGEANPTFGARYEGFVFDQSETALSGSLTFITTATASSGVGSYAITPSGVTSENYEVSFLPGALSVTKAALTVTADGKSKVYGSADPVFTVNYNGFVAGDDSADLAGALTLTRAAGEPVGNYTITPAGLISNNYDIEFRTGVLQITKKALAVTAENATKTYGEANPTFGARYEGFVFDQSETALSGSLTFITTATASSGVGSYAITPSGLTGNNYEISFVPGTLNVAKAPLTVTADGKNKVYGSADPAFTVSYGGFVAGDDSGDLAGTLTVTRAAGENVGSYAITPTGLTSDNYSIEFVPGVLQVTEQDLTITAVSTSKVYGSADPAFTVGYSGFVAGDGVADLTGTLTVTRVGGENVGSYAISPSGLTSDNYEISFVPGVLSVTKATLTVTADGKNKVYGSADPAFTVSYSGFVAGDDHGDLTGELTLAREEGENVGSYTITPSGLASENYTISFLPGTLVIDKATLTVTADDKSKVYGAEDTVLSYTPSGTLYHGDQYNVITGVTMTTVTGKVATAGEHEISISGGTAVNYTIVPVAGKLQVQRKQINATGITALSKYYDGTPAARLQLSQAELVGVEEGDDVSLDVTAAAGTFGDSQIGIGKPVAVAGLQLVGEDKDNYELLPYQAVASIIEEDEPVKPTPPPGTGVDVTFNGNVQGNSATAVTETDAQGTTTTRVVFDAAKLGAKLADEAGDNSLISVVVNNDADRVVGELTGQMVKYMESRSATVQISTGLASYTLPAAEISIDAVAQQLGESVSLQDVTVHVEITNPDLDTVTAVEDAANAGNYLLVVPPVEFAVSCTYGDQTMQVSQFNAYVERTIAIPDGVDYSRVTTAVVLQPDGTFRSVPTRVVVIDGKYHATVNSLTNSTYTVIWNPISFADMVGHWAEGPANDMSSRLVMPGETAEMFGASGNVTRLEFIATLVKALGLASGTGSSPFVDLRPGDESYGYALTAYQYQLIGGYPGSALLPNDRITREQAMSMVVAAMRVTGLDNRLTAEEVSSLLAEYSDGDAVSDWARGVVAACIDSGIIGGRPGRVIAPQDLVTRAELAAIAQRLLRQSSLI